MAAEPQPRNLNLPKILTGKLPGSELLVALMNPRRLPPFSVNPVGFELRSKDRESLVKVDSGLSVGFTLKHDQLSGIGLDSASLVQCLDTGGRTISRPQEQAELISGDPAVAANVLTLVRRFSPESPRLATQFMGKGRSFHIAYYIDRPSGPEKRRFSAAPEGQKRGSVRYKVEEYIPDIYLEEINTAMDRIIEAANAYESTRTPRP